MKKYVSDKKMLSLLGLSLVASTQEGCNNLDRSSVQQGDFTYFSTSGAFMQCISESMATMGYGSNQFEQKMKHAVPSYSTKEACISAFANVKVNDGIFAPDRIECVEVTMGYAEAKVCQEQKEVVSVDYSEEYGENHVEDEVVETAICSDNKPKEEKTKFYIPMVVNGNNKQDFDEYYFEWFSSGIKSGKAFSPTQKAIEYKYNTSIEPSGFFLEGKPTLSMDSYKLLATRIDSCGGSVEDKNNMKQEMSAFLNPSNIANPDYRPNHGSSNSFLMWYMLGRMSGGNGFSPMSQPSFLSGSTRLNNPSPTNYYSANSNGVKYAPMNYVDAQNKMSNYNNMKTYSRGANGKLSVKSGSYSFKSGGFGGRSSGGS